jgi:hypothetical protein
MDYTVFDNELLNNLASHILTPIVYNEFIKNKIGNRIENNNMRNDIESELESKNNNMRNDIENNNMRNDIESELESKNKSIENKLDNQYNCLFTPEQEDTLFWCIFISHFGYYEYNLIETKYKNFEIKEKFKIVEFLKSNKNCLKRNKITKIETEEIMGKMMSCNISDLKNLHGICAYYKINVLVVNKRKMTYVSYNYSENDNVEKDENVIIVYKSNSLLTLTKCKYSISSICEASSIVENYVKFESFDKPFNGISTYKLIDLESISKKLGLETKRKKSEIYREINIAVA